MLSNIIAIGFDYVKNTKDYKILFLHSGHFKKVLIGLKMQSQNSLAFIENKIFNFWNVRINEENKYLFYYTCNAYTFIILPSKKLFLDNY